MKSYNFQKLTPINNIEDMGVYASALDFVFTNEDLRNIAVTGPYGAGKSSLVESYKKKSPYRFLHISLAHFEETGKEVLKDGAGEKGLGREKVLEGKILNQLLHQIDVRDIGQTNFKVKRHVSQEEVVKRAGYITLFFLLAFYLTRFGAWRELLLAWPDSFLREVLLVTLSPYAVLLAGCVLGGLFLRGVCKVILLQKTRNLFKKLKFEGNELELFEEDKESYFDRYLNEVLYLFEHANADVIVFEDLDRFEMVGIFERLREINRLVNGRRGREGKPVIRFFYLLRDDIFTGKDRTKFFDYIIPVIPVLNGSNAREKFLQFFEEAGISGDFDRVFLRDASLYIDEMRILQNIYNEYVIYSKKISFIGLDSSKLLAMVIYKNLFPRDFHDLHLRQGYVNQVFAGKKFYMEKEREKKEEELRKKGEKMRKELQELSKGQERDLDELDALFFNFDKGRLRIGGKEKSAYESNDQILRDMKANSANIQYYFENYFTSGEWRTYPFQEEYQKLSRNPEYAKRKKQIEERAAGRIQALKEQIAKEDKRAEEEMANLESWKIKDFITRKQLDELIYTDPTGRTESFDSVKTSPYFPLLRYLLSEGWLDETYPDYISYFYEGSIRRQEKEFLLSIAERKAKPYTFDPKPTLELLNNLDRRDFSREEILNYALLELLMESRAEYRSFFDAFLKLLKDTGNLKFIMGYYRYTRYPKCFVEELHEHWPEAAGQILEEEEFSLADRKDYLTDTILTCVEQDSRDAYLWESRLQMLNTDDCITGYINAHREFLCIQDSNVDNILQGYIQLGVKVETWAFEPEYQKMCLEIYKNNQYLLSGENIEAVFKAFFLHEGEEWRWEDAATRILTREGEPVCGYVKENLDVFLYIVFESAKGPLTDREETVLLLLNEKSVSLDKKKQYVAQMRDPITHLRDVKDKSLWDGILACEGAACTEENILTYYFQGAGKWTDTLTGFINGGAGKLDFGFLRGDKSYGEEAGSHFWEDVLVCKELKDEKFEEILTSMWFFYNRFGRKGFGESRLEILIRRRVIRMTAENLKFIREHYGARILFPPDASGDPDLGLSAPSYFAKNNMDAYLSLAAGDLFSMEELLELLEDRDISVGVKKKLLDKTTGKIPVTGKTYTPAVRQKILAEHFDEGDLEFLLLNYEREREEKSREVIREIAVSHVEEILEQEYPVAPALMRELVGEERLEISHRKLLLSRNLSAFSREETVALLEQAELTRILPVFEGRNPRVQKCEITDNLISVFQQKGWLGKAREEVTGGVTFYRLYRRGKG